MTTNQLNTTAGTNDLCAWQPVRGVVWVQTRNPDHARRLAKRSDSRLVVTGVSGGYLRTFEFRKGMAWAVRLIKRYMGNGKAANAARNRAVCPETSRGHLAARVVAKKVEAANAA